MYVWKLPPHIHIGFFILIDAGLNFVDRVVVPRVIRKERRTIDSTNAGAFGGQRCLRRLREASEIIPIQKVEDAFFASTNHVVRPRYEYRPCRPQIEIDIVLPLRTIGGKPAANPNVRTFGRALTPSDLDIEPHEAVT
jgi:hypothetical protein